MCVSKFVFANGHFDTCATADLKQLGLDYVDLMLLHWGCESMDETVKVYQQVINSIKTSLYKI